MLRIFRNVRSKKPKQRPYFRPPHIPKPQVIAGLNGHTLSFRTDIAKLLPPGGVGVELGVAEGEFSDALLKNSSLAHLYSVDMYAGDHNHGIDQYRRATKLLDAHRARSTLLRMRFDEAVVLFPDSYFDFIYVDGYAHTGEENGQTLRDWWPKLKPGGLFAGDDYDPKWPRVMEEVDRFAYENGLTISLISGRRDAPKYSRYPSWLIFKPKPRNSSPAS